MLQDKAAIGLTHPVHAQPRQLKPRQAGRWYASGNTKTPAPQPTGLRPHSQPITHTSISMGLPGHTASREYAATLYVRPGTRSPHCGGALGTSSRTEPAFPASPRLRLPGLKLTSRRAPFWPRARWCS